MPKISIIVPVYGVQDYIKKCMESIVNQTFNDFEIIIVDDETKDDSIKIIEEHFHDNRIKIYHKKNGGLADARNYGIKRATGEYLFFVDSDDYLDVNCLQEMYKKAETDNSDIVICDYFKAYEDGNLILEKMIPYYNPNNTKTAVIAMPAAWGKLVKRKIVQKYHIEFLSKHYFEDNAIMPFLCAVCKKISYLSKPFYYYVQRNGSILNRKEYDKKWEDIYDSLDYLYNKFEENNLLKEFYQELEYIYIEYLLHGPCLRFIKYKEGLHNIEKIDQIMKEKFPNWKKNNYYQKENIKYKIICTLFYHHQIRIAKLLLKNR